MKVYRENEFGCVEESNFLCDTDKELEIGDIVVKDNIAYDITMIGVRNNQQTICYVETIGEYPRVVNKEIDCKDMVQCPNCFLLYNPIKNEKQKHCIRCGYDFNIEEVDNYYKTTLTNKIEVIIL